LNYNCPECGSDRTTKYSIYLKSKKSNSGCLMFLLIILILLIAPGIVLSVLAASGIAILSILPILLPLILIAILIMVIADLIRYRNKYICERCGKKFRL